MLKKITRQKAIIEFPNFPLRNYDLKKEDEVYYSPKTFADYVVEFSSKTSYNGRNKLFAIELINLAKQFNCDNLIFLGDESTPWLKRFNTYSTFQKSLQYLVDKKIGKRFNGAFQVDISEFPIFIKHLIWLIHTNGVLPNIHFVDPAQNIIGNICHHGHLHISTKNKIADNLFHKFISASKLEFLNEN